MASQERVPNYIWLLLLPNDYPSYSQQLRFLAYLFANRSYLDGRLRRTPRGGPFKWDVSVLELIFGYVFLLTNHRLSDPTHSYNDWYGKHARCTQQ